MFTNQIAVVTGGASGIGREICLFLASQGATVIIADIDRARMADLSELIHRRGGNCRVKKVDVTQESEVRALVAGVVDEFHRIDLLFNNAGIGVDGEFVDATLEDWKRILDVNLWGVIYGTYHAYKVMKTQGFGQIVNVSSLAGLLPGGLMTSYVASKHAVLGLTLSLRAEAFQYGIKVNALCPGFIETEIHDRTPKVSEYLRTLPNKGKGTIFPRAEQCVRTMMAGVRRNSAIIIAPRAHRLFWWIYRLLPSLVPHLWRLIIARLKSDHKKRQASMPGM